MQIPEAYNLSQFIQPELSVTALFFIFLFATLISEDMACLLAGTTAASGRISLPLAILSCFLGIVLGDLLLFAAGRILGTRLLDSRIIKRFVSDAARKKASVLIAANAGLTIFVSRFVTGIRLPTYLIAGALNTNFRVFAFYVLLASAIWTPLLVSTAAAAQNFLFQGNMIVGIIVLLIVVRIILFLASYRNRRLLIGKIRCIWNWEFWPLWLFYLPVVIYIFLLGVRYRDLTLFTAANPAIPGGGFKGESKNAIYESLSCIPAASNHILAHKLIPLTAPPELRLSTATYFMKTNALDFPIVVKPDAGERGAGVTIVRNRKELEAVILTAKYDVILQQFADGPEISIFYYRYPDRQNGSIFSITEKQFPFVTGDGRSTLELLILNDHRAVCLAKKYFECNRDRLAEIPPAGINVKIVELGTHSRGAIFLDGKRLLTDALLCKIDEICRHYPGFFFGRFDIRGGTIEDLRNGENFKIVELNGVTSESTNIYDPAYSLADAYRVLFAQWKIAFEIGAMNARRGFPSIGVMNLLRLIFSRTMKAQGSVKGESMSAFRRSKL
jgi:membrane protein DedA with SNARE-associated domain